MRYLALDVASTTGFAIIDVNEDNRVVNFGKILTTGSIKNKIHQLYSEISKLIKIYKPDMIMMEDIYCYKNIKGFKILSYLQAACILSTIGLKNDIPIIALSSRSVRKVLGIVNNERKQIKNDVIIFVNKNLNLTLNVKDHSDIADAIILILSYIKDPNQYQLNFGE